MSHLLDDHAIHFGTELQAVVARPQAIMPGQPARSGFAPLRSGQSAKRTNNSTILPLIGFGSLPNCRVQVKLRPA